RDGMRGDPRCVERGRAGRSGAAERGTGAARTDCLHVDQDGADDGEAGTGAGTGTSTGTGTGDRRSKGGPMNLLDFLADARPHLFDGAMGTMLYQKGIFINRCYDELNLREPELVKDVHRAYVR